MTTPKPFPCDVCKRGFDTANSLRMHRNSLHPSPGRARRRAAYEERRDLHDDTPQWQIETGS